MNKKNIERYFDCLFLKVIFKISMKPLSYEILASVYFQLKCIIKSVSLFLSFEINLK